MWCAARRRRDGSGTYTTGTADIPWCDAAACFLRLARIGNTFYASVSSDGQTWPTQPQGSVTLSSMPDQVAAGAVLSAHNQQAVATGVMDRLTLQADGQDPKEAPCTGDASWTCSPIGMEAHPDTADSDGQGTWTLSSITASR